MVPPRNVIKKNDTIGELVYQGDNVTMGYAESCFDLQNDDENDGILHTGDLAKLDPDGFYYITARIKRFLKMYGNRVNLDEIEDLIKSNGYECACSGNDQHINIYFVEAGIEKKIMNLITINMNISKRYIKFKLINNIPRTHSGKIQYQNL